MAEQQQGNIQQNPKIAAVGLNLGNIPTQVKPGQLSWAINAIVENFDGNSVTYGNEPANESCFSFPDGYQVVGRLNIIEDSLLIFWLANPTTGQSEIGTATNCVYSKLINASCLNLSIYHPILKVVYKKTNCGTEIYWTDAYNTRRYLNLSSLPFKEISGCPPIITDEVDCNKLSVQPNFSIPEISIDSVDTDGSIVSGAYQFAIQYSNSLGEGYTSYYSITNPLPVFDPTKITQDFNYEVGKSINITISNIDITGYYDYINLAVIKTVNNITSVELVGTYQITSSLKTITYTGQGVQDRLTIADVFEKFPIYEVAADLTTAQDILIWDGLTTDERISYQEIANTIKVQWQTYRLRGDKPYANELNAAYKREYMRDEVYAFEFVPLLRNGKQVDGFHIPGRISTPFDLEPIMNNDVPSDGTGDCAPPPIPTPRWRVYNTGTVVGNSSQYNPSDPCYEGPFQYGDMSYWESSDVYPCNPLYGFLQNQTIRHHKFPDSLVTHIHDNEGYIFPIGVNINLANIYDAIQNSSLTQQQKDGIVGFKIVRGNRANNKSIVAKGIIHNVGQYTTEETTYFFPNYPYNDLRTDPFITGTSYPNTTNSRYVFHSPDTHFFQPFLGNILKLETAEYGKSRGHFVQVEKHAKYKLYATGIYTAALATAAALLALSLNVGIGSSGFDPSGAIIGYQTIVDILQRTAPRINPTYQYNSVGDYTSYAPITNSGNKQRSLDIAAYISPGMISVGDTHNINNFQRESSVYLRTTNILPPITSIVGVPEDVSRYTLSGEGICNTPAKVVEKNISSYYASIRKSFRNQYGQLYSYDTIDTGFQFLFPATINDIYKDPIRTIFGGDVFINKFGYKSKLPFFIDNRVNSVDESDVFYNELFNVGLVNYWFSMDPTQNSGAFQIIYGVPTVHMDCEDTTFLVQKGKMYLFAFGIPYFYVESEVNVDLRQAFNSTNGEFYPHVASGIPDTWLQEANTTIQQDNTYWYNKTFSKQNKENTFTHIPDDFTPSLCTTTFPFRAIFSEQQKDFVNNRRNNWLVYRPAAFYDFPQNFGPLTSLDGIENKQVLARFENKSLLYNALLTAPTSAADVYLGQSLFSQQVPPLDFAETDLGFAGSQHKFLLKTEYGHISCDAKRGQILSFNGQQVKEISAPDEVNKFFTTYLEFQLKKAFPSYNVDNNYNGVGLHGTYDSKYNRLLITKTDYKPLTGDISLRDNRFYRGDTEVFLTQSTYFTNYSFTVSYNFDTRQWISFHTYLPNYYIGESNFFYSGILNSLWTHNTTDTKYNNFYGVIHPFTIEYVHSFQYNDEILQNIKDYTKVIEYTNWQEFIETDDVWYDEVVLYNAQQSSGILKPKPKPLNNLSAYTSYPIYNADSKEITFTKKDNFYQLDTFWALTKSPKIPIWTPSIQNLSIFKELNQANCDYSKRSFKKAPLRAKDLKCRFTLNTRDDVKFITIFTTAPTMVSYL